MFLRTIIKNFRESANTNGEGLFGDSAGSGIKESWFDDAMSEHIATSGGVGLADRLIIDWGDAGRIADVHAEPEKAPAPLLSRPKATSSGACARNSKECSCELPHPRTPRGNRLAELDPKTDSAAAGTRERDPAADCRDEAIAASSSSPETQTQLNGAAADELEQLAARCFELEQQRLTTMREISDYVGVPMPALTSSRLRHVVDRHRRPAPGQPGEAHQVGGRGTARREQGRRESARLVRSLARRPDAASSRAPSRTPRPTPAMARPLPRASKGSWTPGSEEEAPWDSASDSTLDCAD